MCSCYSVCTQKLSPMSTVLPRKTPMQEKKWKHVVVLTLCWVSVTGVLMQLEGS
jgi:hypothetical protein